MILWHESSMTLESFFVAMTVTGIVQYGDTAGACDQLVFMGMCVQGAWRYIRPRLETAMRENLPEGTKVPELRYIGRATAAAPGLDFLCLLLIFAC